MPDAVTSPRLSMLRTSSGLEGYRRGAPVPEGCPLQKALANDPPRQEIE
jgi:hypothetical protein